MTLTNAAIKILRQLSDVINQISDSDFSRPSPTLGGSTIGQHIRHTLEFFICFQSGYRTGVLNYDKRGHDPLIETDKSIALGCIEQVIAFVERMEQNHGLRLEVGYDPGKDTYEMVETNSVRELVYNIEHAVHHMAIIKIGLKEVSPYVVLKEDFGIAASTLRHLRRATPFVQNLNGDFPS